MMYKIKLQIFNRDINNNVKFYPQLNIARCTFAVLHRYRMLVLKGTEK